ncbi:MAG TPA: MerC domain-containing protein, partial [Mucilaginibacter sp.]
MKVVKHKSGLDNVGMTASVLCAIHCALVPLLITSLPLLGLGFLANPWLEWSMIILALF